MKMSTNLDGPEEEATWLSFSSSFSKGFISVSFEITHVSIRWLIPLKKKIKVDTVSKQWVEGSFVMTPLTLFLPHLQNICQLANIFFLGTVQNLSPTAEEWGGECVIYKHYNNCSIHSHVDHASSSHLQMKFFCRFICFYYFVCMCGFACLFVCTICVWSPEVLQGLWTRLPDGGWLPFGW